MPDANPQFALNSIVGAAFGAAGQRCMQVESLKSASFADQGGCRALSVLVTVGETDQWLGGIVDRAKRLNIGNGFAEGIDV